MSRTDFPCINEPTSKCPCMSPCPLKTCLEVIGGKWKIPVLCAVYQDGPLRYGELKRKITGITNTMLATTLKELESGELIRRKQYDEMPVKVEYSVTDACASLMPILHQLAGWGAERSKEL